MAEYIDKQIILDKCQRLIDVERKQGSDVMNYGRERVNQTEVIMEYIEYMTPANVIERSKIDEAIEVFRKEIEENHLNVIDYVDREWLVKDFIYGAIDRLKRNIGE